MDAQTKTTMPISIRFEADVLENLRRMARYESYERNQDVTYSDLIREAVLQVYPLPKDAHADENDES